MNKSKKSMKKAINKLMWQIKEYSKLKYSVALDEKARLLFEANKVLINLNYYLKISKIKEVEYSQESPLKQADKPTLVKVRPCSNNPDNRTYLGFLLGDLARFPTMNIWKSKVLLSFGYHNPAIYIPETGRTVFGYESWWGEIENADDLKDITDQTISNVWYVQALEALGKASKELKSQEHPMPEGGY